MVPSKKWHEKRMRRFTELTGDVREYRIRWFGDADDIQFDGPFLPILPGAFDGTIENVSVRRAKPATDESADDG